MLREAAAIDELDRQLVERLRADGRESNRALARTLRINEVTVATRLRRLEGARLVHVTALADMRAFGYGYLAFAFVNVAGRPVVAVAQELALLSHTISVSATSGRFDVVATVIAHDRAELGDAIGRDIPQVPGVTAVRAELALDVLRFDSDWAALGADAGKAPPVAELRGADDLDMAIVHALQHDARRSNRAIAAELGVSEGTVRARLRRLEVERAIHIKAIKDVRAFGLAANAFVGIRVSDGRVETVGRALQDVPGIAVLVRSLGEFDFLLVAMAESRAEMIDLVLDRLARIPGVRSTETFENYATPKHVYTWARLG